MVCSRAQHIYARGAPWRSFAAKRGSFSPTYAFTFLRACARGLARAFYFVAYLLAARHRSRRPLPTTGWFVQFCSFAAPAFCFAFLRPPPFPFAYSHTYSTFLVLCARLPPRLLRATTITTPTAPLYGIIPSNTLTHALRRPFYYIPSSAYY